MQAQTAIQTQFINSITHGDCIKIMHEMPANSVDFILTDPPYLVNYRDRSGRSIQNDVNALAQTSHGGSVSRTQAGPGLLSCTMAGAAWMPSSKRGAAQVFSLLDISYFARATVMWHSGLCGTSLPYARIALPA